jgi:LysR family transcriptional regulator for metE and metH
VQHIPAQPSLEIRDLQVVIALATARTTARAAELLHLTQPAVSRALLSIESRLGTQLFERTPRGLTATEAGRQLIAGASRVLAELGTLELSVCAPVAVPAKIRLVCECHTAYHWLPSTLAELRGAMPALKVSLSVEHTADPVAALTAGQIDVALLSVADVPRQIAEAELFTDEIVFAVAASHPLAAKPALTRPDLRSHTILTSLHAPRSEQRWFINQVFGRERPKLQLQRLPLTEAIVDFARAGMGIAILSEWLAAPHLARGGLVTKRLGSGALARNWRIAWRPQAAPVIPHLRAALVRGRAALAANA